MIKIENNRLTGTIEKNNVQYLHGTKDVGPYPVKVTIDGTPLPLIESLIMDAAVIRSRKRYKTKSQVELLAKGVTLSAFVSAQAPQTAEELAASLDVDAMSDAGLVALAEKINANIAAKKAAAEAAAESENK